jgi:hypothetical protein
MKERQECRKERQAGRQAGKAGKRQAAGRPSQLLPPSPKSKEKSQQLFSLTSKGRY